MATWLDSASGLVWQKSPNDSKMTWSAAWAYCSDLSPESGDWRLPTIGELRSLIRGCAPTEDSAICNVEEGDCLSVSCRDTSCDGCSYLDGPGAGGCYWPEEVEGDCYRYYSSSEVADVVDHAWVVHFVSGAVNENNVGFSEYVRCVYQPD